MAAGKKHEDRVRRLCLSLPEVSEKISHGCPTFFVKKKVFAYYTEDHHGDGRIAVQVPKPMGIQEMLIEANPKRFFRPPYVGVKGWVGIILPEVGDAELAEHIKEAWTMIAPVTVRKKLAG